MIPQSLGLRIFFLISPLLSMLNFNFIWLGNLVTGYIKFVYLQVYNLRIGGFLAQFKV